MAPAKISLALALNLLMTTTSGPFQIDVRIGIGVGRDAAVGVLDLDHRPVVDEQAGEVDGLGQRAAAVGAEVHHHGVDALVLEVFEDAVDVAGGALVVGLAAGGRRPCPCRSWAG